MLPFEAPEYPTKFDRTRAIATGEVVCHYLIVDGELIEKLTYPGIDEQDVRAGVAAETGQIVEHCGKASHKLAASLLRVMT
ncbi:MAG: hypothetical protein ACREGF_05725 [Candidatus Saccharimonadales bacterium]